MSLPCPKLKSRQSSLQVVRKKVILTNVVVLTVLVLFLVFSNRYDLREIRCDPNSQPALLQTENVSVEKAERVRETLAN